ncbi:MAG: hypothetical protein Ct9H300mP28_13240 [Pseudomonadota bacterium]|nr:MAG: hypothetical protein Ct9H300mP28_13240 [Pseudomonadota bacterium]
MARLCPLYQDSFSEEDRWALAYFVVSLSAFTDPLTGKPLLITKNDKENLNNPELKAHASRLGYKRVLQNTLRENMLVKHGLEEKELNCSKINKEMT